MGYWDAFPKHRLLADVSLWSADLSRLAGEIERVDEWADLWHFDVADAHFVPGLLFFPDLVASVRGLTRRPFTVHLMTANPLPLIDEFARAGADLVLVHCENGPVAAEALRCMAERRLGRGLALGLDCPLELLEPYLQDIDMVLLMGTPLGAKGQPLSPLAVPRVRRLRTMLRERGLDGRVLIEADGGIRVTTVPELRQAGADVIVPGSLVFKSGNLQETMSWIRSF